MNTFQALMDSATATGDPTSLLIGNGFSRAWDPNIFSYETLLGEADFGTRDAVIHNLFSEINTFDFEAVMARLKGAELVVTIYGGNPALLAQIREDQEQLKNALINVISRTHPDLPQRVSDPQYTAVRGFLSPFNKVFTVNYDLLPYWARNKPGLGPDWESDDGFRAGQLWQESGTNQDFFLLHGGLHIYESGTETHKHACTVSGQTIVQQVRANLIAGSFPLFVSEPTHEQKKARIMRSAYLRHAFHALGELDGTLFIHGHSMDETDKHIFDRVRASSVRHVYVSVFGDENSESNLRVVANARAYLSGSGRVVDFYQAESAPIWS